jgi:hypothetical protein
MDGRKVITGRDSSRVPISGMPKGVEHAQLQLTPDQIVRVPISGMPNGQRHGAPVLVQVKPRPRVGQTRFCSRFH